MQLNLVLALFLVAVIICALIPQEVAAEPKDQAGKKKTKKNRWICAIPIMKLNCDDCCNMYYMRKVQGTGIFCVCEPMPPPVRPEPRGLRIQRALRKQEDALKKKEQAEAAR